MTRIFKIHPDDPQLRLVRHVADLLKDGKIIAYPTDSTYALGCMLNEKKAAEKIMKIRGLKKNHFFSLVCRDLSDLASFARVDNSVYRLLKAYTPGPFTFILPASREVPRRLQSPKRRTVGLRIPKNNIVMAILDQLCGPIMSVTLKLAGQELPMIDPENIYNSINGQVDAIVDGGLCGYEGTTVVDLADGPTVIREGKGEIKLL